MGFNIEEAEKERRINFFLDAAEKMRAEDEIDLAIRLAKKALRIDTENTKALLLLADCYSYSEKREMAEETYQKALGADKQNLLALEAYGVYLVESDREAEGIEYLKTFFDRTDWQEGNSLGAFIFASQTLDRQEYIIEAFRVIWEKSLSQLKGFRYAHQLRHKGDFDAAIQILQMISSYKPDPVVLNELGLCLGEKGRWQEAAHIFEQAANTKVDPDETEDKLESTIRDYSFYWGNLSFALLEIDDVDKALSAAETALQVNDSNLYPWERKLDALMHLYKHEEVVELAQEIQKRFTTTPDMNLSEVFDTEAFALRYLGRDEEAIRIYESAREKYPENWDFLNGIIDLLIEKQAFQKASEILAAVDESIFSPREQLILLSQEMTLLEYLKRQDAIRPAVEKLIHNVWPEQRDLLVGEIQERVYFSEPLMDELLNSLVDLIPDSPCFVMLQAQQAFIRGQFSKAKELLEKALTYPSSDEEKLQILNGLGIVYLVLAEPGRAHQVLAEAISLSETIIETKLADYSGPDLSWHGFFKEGKIIVEESDSITYGDVVSAVKINLVSSFLFERRIEQAYESVGGFIESLNDPQKIGLIYALLGYIDLARGDRQAARIAWKIANKNGYRSDRMTAELIELDTGLKK